MNNLLSTKDAATYLKICPATLLNLAKSGMIDVYRPTSRRFYFTKESLDKYIQQNTVRAV